MNMNPQLLSTIRRWIPSHGVVSAMGGMLAFLLPLANVFGQLATSNTASSSSPSDRTRILFVGDVMLDGGPGHVVASGKDPFLACKNLFENVDLSIANLECVLGYEGEQQLKPYTFRGAIDSPRFLKKYFHAVGLANNHSLDFGPDGLIGMMDVLDQEKLPYFGAGRNLKEAQKPFVFECKGHKIAVLAINEYSADAYAATTERAGNAPLRERDVVEAIRHARENLKCDIVIPYLHWGEELYTEPRPDQKASARRWIDAGASAIIGAHPHVTQTLEIYKGAPIAYSLGNFVFDYFPSDPPEWSGWVVILEVDAAGHIDVDIRTVTMDGSGCPKPAETE